MRECNVGWTDVVRPRQRCILAPHILVVGPHAVTICFGNMAASHVTVLTDYDNLAMSFVGRGDTASAFPNVADTVITCILSYLPRLVSVDIRLYGGWLDEYGYFSHTAQRILPELRHFRGRRGATRFATSLALTLRGVPTCRLLGSVRSKGTRHRQKMVDGMMTLDIFHAAVDCSAVAIVSDDDDLVPAALLTARSGGEVYWLRSRNRASCNDDLLTRTSVTFLPLL